ncbi:MAG: hypothetical protein IMZ55_10165 [Acidobacteria bacterium]|nr:hypothetical protein [Acidobacteriota bacterium]
MSDTWLKDRLIQVMRQAHRLDLALFDEPFLMKSLERRLAAERRERVGFSVCDLLDTRSTCPAASIFGEFDVVLCCNLLLYYRPDIRRFILGKVQGCLAPNSYLVTGEAERELVQGASGLRAVAPPAAVFHRER